MFAAESHLNPHATPWEVIRTSQAFLRASGAIEESKRRALNRYWYGKLCDVTNDHQLTVYQPWVDYSIVTWQVAAVVNTLVKNPIRKASYPQQEEILVEGWVIDLSTNIIHMAMQWPLLMQAFITWLFNYPHIRSSITLRMFLTTNLLRRIGLSRERIPLSLVRLLISTSPPLIGSLVRKWERQWILFATNSYRYDISKYLREYFGGKCGVSLYGYELPPFLTSSAPGMIPTDYSNIHLHRCFIQSIVRGDKSAYAWFLPRMVPHVHMKQMHDAVEAFVYHSRLDMLRQYVSHENWLHGSAMRHALTARGMRIAVSWCNVEALEYLATIEDDKSNCSALYALRALERQTLSFHAIMADTAGDPIIEEPTWIDKARNMLSLVAQAQGPSHGSHI